LDELHRRTPVEAGGCASSANIKVPNIGEVVIDAAGDALDVVAGTSIPSETVSRAALGSAYMATAIVLGFAGTVTSTVSVQVLLAPCLAGEELACFLLADCS
jgi:hypothetical protein